MIDTHCHLTYPGLHERIDGVLAAAADAGVTRLISVATTPIDGLEALKLAETYPQVYATVGVHPGHADEYDSPDEYLEGMKQIAPFVAHPRVVAIGEMGLDKHYDHPPLDVQRRVFHYQLDLAKTISKKPIIIHNREATDDVLGMIRDSGLPGERFLFHCFTGSAAELDRVLDVGAWVGFTGIVTFKSARDLAEASDRVPLDRLVVETDAPYLTPEPHRKVKTNEPRYVADVARFLAQRRGMTYEDFEAAVDANAERFFGLPIQGGTG